MKTLLVALSASLLIASACTKDDDAVQDDEVTEESTTGSTTEGPETLTPSDELSNISPAAFGDVQEVDEDTISVEFEMLSPECHGFQPVIQESATDVAVAVQVGNLPGKSDADCAYDLNQYEVEIDLESPIGDRNLRAAEEIEPAEVSGSAEEIVVVDDEAGAEAEVSEEDEITEVE